MKKLKFFLQILLQDRQREFGQTRKNLRSTEHSAVLEHENVRNSSS